MHRKFIIFISTFFLKKINKVIAIVAGSVPMLFPFENFNAGHIFFMDCLQICKQEPFGQDLQKELTKLGLANK